MDLVQYHLTIAWAGMLLGIAAGAGLGLFFHKKDFLGGYDALPRRLLRLGHISFFGIGFLNAFFALTLPLKEMTPAAAETASWGFTTAAIGMPLLCTLSAWHQSFRHLFFVPVLGAASGMLLILMG